jgi:hypothetical protein
LQRFHGLVQVHFGALCLIYIANDPHQAFFQLTDVWTFPVFKADIQAAAEKGEVLHDARVAALVGRTAASCSRGERPVRADSIKHYPHDKGQPKVGSKQRTQLAPKLGLRAQRH